MNNEASCFVADTCRHGWCRATVSVVAPHIGLTATHRSNDTSPSTYSFMIDLYTANIPHNRARL